jgi:hypothetical protein
MAITHGSERLDCIGQNPLILQLLKITPQTTQPVVKTIHKDWRLPIKELHRLIVRLVRLHAGRRVGLCILGYVTGKRTENRNLLRI